MKNLIAGVMFAMLLFSGTTAHAQNTNVQELMATLRADHAELKNQVDAGELTKEEAKELWQEKIAEAREAKEEFFSERVAKTEAKIAEIAENNPERAALLEERLATTEERREEQKVKREAVREQIQSGEITREEAVLIKKEARQENIQERTENKEAFEEKRAELKEARVERQENAPENFQDRPGGRR
jgi:polyhydroxyalkanoate synthesis regulator phasin